MLNMMNFNSAKILNNKNIMAIDSNINNNNRIAALKGSNWLQVVFTNLKLNQGSIQSTLQRL